MYLRSVLLILILIKIVFSVNTNDTDGIKNTDSKKVSEKLTATSFEFNFGCENCLQKCCPSGKYVEKKICYPYKKQLDFSDVSVYATNMVKTDKSLKDTFDLIPGKLVTDIIFSISAFDVSIFKFNSYLKENGDLWLEMPNTYERWTIINRSNFCVDYRPSKKKKLVPQFWAIIPPTDMNESDIYLTAAILVSCVFLLLVLIVYALLPELRNLCGMILMAYVGSLFCAFLLLAVIQITTHDKEVCLGLTIMIYFFFLASFCWMNVMSYDIWWTFRGYAKARPIHRRGENFKFLMYCLYAWGVPLLMAIGLGVINETDMTHLPWFVTPNIPKTGCFLEGGSKFLYLYVPMLIMIAFNWLFYLMTAYNIWRLSRGTAVLSTCSARGTKQAHRTHRHRLMLYLKLSILMGLNWLFEVISFLSPHFKVWYISDVYNILIGFAIFLIFVCKRQILKKLVKWYHSKRTNWRPSSKSYASSVSDSNSNQETISLQISTNPKGF